MCGIFGFSFHDGEKELVSEGRRALLAYKLAEGNDSRGGHSWGVVHINADRYRIEKGLGCLTERPFQLLGAHTLMAHTRYATHGEKTVANAHPFEFPTLVGAHNGVFNNHYTLNRKHNRDFAVDSMHAFAHLEADLDFSEIEGYGTLEWFKKDQPKRIYLCQMRSGDLSVYGLGSAKEVRGVVWSSDEKHLREGLRASGFKKFFEYKLDRERVYYVEDGILYYTDQHLKLGTPEYHHSWRGGYSSGHWDAKLGEWITPEDEARGFIKTREWDSEKKEYKYDVVILDQAKFEAYMQGEDKKKEDTQPIILTSQPANDEPTMKALAEKLAYAVRSLQMAADMGDTEAEMILDCYRDGSMDGTDLIKAVEEGGAGMTRDEIPTAEEEAAEEAAALLDTDTFHSDMKELSDKWERLDKGLETGKIHDEDVDLALFMRGR